MKPIPQFLRSFLCQFAVCLGTLWLGLAPCSIVQGQTVPSPGTAEQEKLEIPPAEDVTLVTADGVDLRCTYFEAFHKEAPATSVVGNAPPAEPGKTTLPFILLHDWEGSRQDLNAYGQLLQKAGCAVIIPDLRGHGESTTMGGGMKSLDLAKFRKPDYASVFNDIEACKRFLVKKNNAGELNIDLLNLLAIGRTATPAMEWVIRDWYRFPPYRGTIKQGQDVKSLILISPTRKLFQINLNVALKHPMFSGRNPQIPNLPTLVVWSDDGSDSDATRESRSIFQAMQKGRPDLKKIADEAERAERETVFDIVIPSRQSGSSLINENSELRITIMEFVAGKVGTKMNDHKWQSRTPKKE